MIQNVGRVMILTLLLSVIAAFPAAAAPYYSYFYDDEGSYYPIPTPYEPGKVLDINNWDKTQKLKDPKDLKADAHGNLIIADSGNNRVVVMDNQGKLLRTLGETEVEKKKLFQPEGVFLDEEGNLYVADTGNRRIVQYDAAGNWLRELPAPQSRLLGPDFKYQPSKLVVNENGYLFVVSTGSVNGLVVLDREGSFHGFFGANTVENTWLDKLIRRLFSREDRKGTGRVTLPYSYNNIAIDQEGYIYATTTGLESDQLRKLNGSGKSVLKSRDYKEKRLNTGKQKTEFTIVSTDKYQNITIIDQTFGHIYQYDQEGHLLFVFGYRGEAPGFISRPVAAATAPNGTMYILEGEQGVVKEFKRAEIANTIHTANDLFQQGKYDEAMIPWQEVYQLDSFYTLALQGIARAELRQGNYAESMSYFKRANDRIGYSEAFVKYRKEQFRKYFNGLVIVVLIGLTAIWALAIVRRRVRAGRERQHANDDASSDAAHITVANRMGAKLPGTDRMGTNRTVANGMGTNHMGTSRMGTNRTVANRMGTNRMGTNRLAFLAVGWAHAVGWVRDVKTVLKQAKKIAFHPFNGFSDLRYESTPRYRDVLWLFLFYFIVHMLSLFFTGYHYMTQNPDQINWWLELGVVVLPWLIYSHVNYGITTITGGEGRYKDVLIASAYAMTPIIFMKLPLVLLSNLFSLEEAEFYSLFQFLVYAWVALLLIVKTREIHSFEWPATFGVSIACLCGFYIVALIGIAAFGLTLQVYDFMSQLAKEVIVRGF